MTSYIQLCEAAAQGEKETLEAYEIQNPEINWNDIRDNQGNTILTCAAMKGKLFLVEWLFERGARVDVTNNNGQIALDFTYPDHPNTSRGLVRLYQKAGLTVSLNDDQLQVLEA